MGVQTLSRLLGTFGQSELATSMLALALAAQMGDLGMSHRMYQAIWNRPVMIFTTCASP